MNPKYFAKMYSHTKKVGSAGRYGTRIGWKIRKEVVRIEDEAKKTKKCPKCGKTQVKRSAAGIWKCNSCSLVFTGGAFIQTTRKKMMEEQSR